MDFTTAKSLENRNAKFTRIHKHTQYFADACVSILYLFEWLRFIPMQKAEFANRLQATHTQSSKKMIKSMDIWKQEHGNTVHEKTEIQQKHW